MRLRLAFALLAALSASPAAAQSDAQVRQTMIRESIAAYRGPCACPYNVDRAGRSCGRRSAHSRPGGAAPLCYPSDISNDEVERWRRDNR